MKIKKFLSLAMALVMLCGVMPMAAFAEDVDYQQGTLVTYGDGDNEHASEAYTITVPALLKPSQSGTVTATGTWASNRVLTVTADATVTLTNSIKAADEKVLDVTFLGIAKAGSNTEAVSATETVAVADIQNALFGVWSGKFNYNVEMTTAEDNTIKANFADNTWTAIATACQNNEVPATWNVGDTKPMQIGDQTVNIRIIGKNHDTYADGSGTAPLTFETVELVERRAFHSENTNLMSWEGSNIREYLNDELFEALDSNVRSNIKEVSKITAAGGGKVYVPTTETIITSDKLFLLSGAEVFDFTNYSYWGDSVHCQEGFQYEYYAQCHDNNADYNEYSIKYGVWNITPPDNLDPEIIKMIEDAIKNGTVAELPEEVLWNQEYFDWVQRSADCWWVRSPRADADTQFGIVGGDGSLLTWKAAYSPTTALGVSFAFCF